jgi:hypothetical protein
MSTSSTPSPTPTSGPTAGATPTSSPRWAKTKRAYATAKAPFRHEWFRTGIIVVLALVLWSYSGPVFNAIAATVTGVTVGDVQVRGNTTILLLATFCLAVLAFVASVCPWPKRLQAAVRHNGTPIALSLVAVVALCALAQAPPIGQPVSPARQAVSSAPGTTSQPPTATTSPTGNTVLPPDYSVPKEDRVVLAAIGGKDRIAGLAFMAWTNQRGSGPNAAWWKKVQEAAESNDLDPADPDVLRTQQKLTAAYGVYIDDNRNITYRSDVFKEAAEASLRTLGVK